MSWAKSPPSRLSVIGDRGQRQQWTLSGTRSPASNDRGGDARARRSRRARSSFPYRLIYTAPPQLRGFSTLASDGRALGTPGFGPAKTELIFRRVGEQLFGVNTSPCPIAITPTVSVRSTT